MWTLVLKTNRYFYWKHEDGFYNCTKDNNPPMSESGYCNLESLRKLKNDNEDNK